MKRTFGRSYSRSGLIALLHRLGFDYRKPEAMPRGLDDAKRQAFIDRYENLLNTMGADEAVVFVDAVHPTHQVRPAGCWARRDVAIAVEQTTGRQRLNIHGAIDLETGQTQILAVEKVSAPGFIKLLGEIEGTHTAMRLIHVFVDQRMACGGRAQNRAALPSALLSASRSHRTVVGLDARKRHPQPGLQDLRRIPPGGHQVPPAYRAQTMEAVLRPNHGQFPRHSPGRFSGSRLAGVEQELRVLLRSVLWNPNDVELDDNAHRKARQSEVHAFVDDTEVARKQRQGLAEIYRDERDVEDQPDLARIRLLCEVKAESPAASAAYSRNSP